MKISEILGVREDQVIQSNRIVRNGKDKRERSLVLSSGSHRFDKALGGGFYMGEIYLIFGSYKTGKTQLCHQLSLQACKEILLDSAEKSPHKKKLIYYFDTENSFRPERLQEMASFCSLDYEHILGRIMVSNIMSNSALLMGLMKLKEKIKTHPPYLIIIDSINNHFRAEQYDSEQPAQKARADFLKILGLLHTITREEKTLTIVTAQVAPSFGEAVQIKEIPAANQFLNHFISEYVYLSYREEEKSYIHLVNSLRNPERKVLYRITAEGIQDYKL